MLATGLLEERGRRIVAIDERALFVYCPRRSDLQDLWARSSRVAMALLEILCYDDDFQALCRFVCPGAPICLKMCVGGAVGGFSALG